MTYVENIFVLLATPLVACLLAVRGRPRALVASLVSGMFCCLLSSYVSTFCAQWVGARDVEAAVEVAPVVEEAVKFLPLLYCLVVLEPDLDDLYLFVVFEAVGFATMESACYLAEYGAASPTMLALRGFSASMMHLSCGSVVGFGVTRIWPHRWFRLPGTFGVLSLAITYHGIYNVLVAWGDEMLPLAFMLPCLVFAVAALLLRKIPVDGMR